MQTVHETAVDHLIKSKQTHPKVADVIDTDIRPVDASHIAFEPAVDFNEARLKLLDNTNREIVEAHGINPTWIGFSSGERSAHQVMREIDSQYVQTTSKT
jgi:hypothetical protein